jgi:hypothetical protein
MRGGKESRMKDQRTRLPVLVVIALLALVLPLALAAAEDHPGPKFIQGTYAVTGMNAALVAPNGFDATLTPMSGEDGSVVWVNVGPQSWEGVYTFHRNGTVDLDVMSRSIDSPPTVWIPPSPSAPPTVIVPFPAKATVAHATAKMHYTLAAGGKITFTLVHESFTNEFLTPAGEPTGDYNYPDTKDTDLVHSWDGRISPDGKTIFVNWGPPLILYLTDGHGKFPGPAFIATGSFTLLRLND